MSSRQDSDWYQQLLREAEAAILRELPWEVFDARASSPDKIAENLIEALFSRGLICEPRQAA